MKDHDKMMVNNLICETLHPSNPIVNLFMLLNKYPVEKQALLIKKYNDYIIKSNVLSKNQFKLIM